MTDNVMLDLAVSEGMRKKMAVVLEGLLDIGVMKELYPEYLAIIEKVLAEDKLLYPISDGGKA